MKPKLWLRKRGKSGHWYIRDGKPFSTVCPADDLEAAQAALERYIAKKAETPPSGSSLLDVPLTLILKAGIKRNGASDKMSAGDRKVRAGLRGAFRKLEAFWGNRKVRDISDASMQEYVRHRIGQRRLMGGGYVSEMTALTELSQLRGELARYGRSTNLFGFPQMSVKGRQRRATYGALTRSDISRMLWAARGRLWDLHLDTWSKSRPMRVRRLIKRKRAYLARLIILSVYTGASASCLFNLRWSGTPTGADSYIDLDAEHPLLYRLGPDAAVGKLAGMPVRLNRRAIAHLRRWRELDAKAGFTHVVHSSKLGAVPTRQSFRKLRNDAGCPTAKLRDLRHAVATFLARNVKVKTRSAALLLGISTRTFDEVFGHLRPNYQAGAMDAFAARPASICRASTWKPGG